MGPYEIDKNGFDLAVERKRLLDTGAIKYRADDRLYRKDRVAINCFHAIAGLTELFPNGGIFGTGFKMWGLNGTARVLIEYTEKATIKGLLLESVDAKKDRYGFICAPTRKGTGFIIPSETRLLTEDSLNMSEADQVHRSGSLTRKVDQPPFAGHRLDPFALRVWLRRAGRALQAPFAPACETCRAPFGFDKP